MPSKPGQRERKPMRWDERQCKALQLLFEGQKTHEQIASDCGGVPTRTLEDWIAHPEFQAALREKRDNLMESLSAAGVLYVRKEQRIVGLAQMATSARAEYEARPWLQEVRPLPQKASVRIRSKKSGTSGGDADSNGSGEPEMEETEPLDAIINESFNRDAFESFRGALDDIAKELGHRKPTPEREPPAGIRIVIESDTNQSVAVGVMAATVDQAALPSPRPGIVITEDAADASDHRRDE